MLREILFKVDFFPSESERASSQKRVLCLLEALVWIDRIYLQEHPETPLIYKSGISYKEPAQFEREDVPEVTAVREYLNKKGAPGSVITAFNSMANQLGRGECFRDIPQIISNGGGDCFPLTQKIIVRSLSTGQYELMAIGDLRHAYTAYEALSYNFKTCKQEFRPIIGFVDKGEKPVSCAHLSNGTDLIATDDHKFWTLRGRKNNFRLESRTMGEYVEDYIAHKEGRMSNGQRTDRSRILQASRIPALDRIKRPSSAEAYLAGIYAAEGEHSDGKHTRIGQHKMQVREKIEAALAEVGTAFHYAPGRGKTAGSGAQYSLHGGLSNPIVRMMRKQGNDSFDKRLPQSFLSASCEIVSKILEGHGDGDAWRPENGSYKRPGVSAVYATSSDQLMEQLRLGLLITGRPAYNYRYEDHGGEGNKPIWRLHEYDENASKLRSRKNLLDDILPSLTYGTVRNARSAGVAHVGCIEVEGNHNFFLADGTLVSNCDNLATWRTAELRERGINAKPYITWRKRADGGTTYHVILIYPDGTTEDPSLLLGMGGDSRAADRQAEVEKLAERTADVLSGDHRSTFGYPAESVLGAMSLARRLRGRR